MNLLLYDVPSVETWKEILRVLKPGAHALVFSSPRTYHRMACGLEDAGFEIRDQIQWLFGSGFPKSLNIEKAGAGKDWAGFGTALKPANEPICLARKPLSEDTVAKKGQKFASLHSKTRKHGMAAVKEGFKFIGIEKEKEYFEIARARNEHREDKTKA